jgi:hypothetical protein
MLQLWSSHVLRLDFVRSLVIHRQEHVRLPGQASLILCSSQPCAVSLGTVDAGQVVVDWRPASSQLDVERDAAQNFANPFGSHCA